MTSKSRALGATLAAAAITALGVQTVAAAFPERPVTLIISSGAGSGGDSTARTYLPFLEACLGQSVVIINRPGAGGALAHAELIAAPADGYTMGNVNMPNTAAQAIQAGKPLPYEQFDYVANVTSSRVTLSVRTNSDFKSLEEFVTYAKANPRVVTLGMSSLGGDDHLTQLTLAATAGIELTMVPFGDGGASRAALLGGHVAAASMSDSEAATYKEQVRPLAIAAEQRSKFLPDTPTMRELGLDVIGGSNQIVAMPKGAPQEALDKVRGCYETVFADAAFKEEAAKRSIPAFYLNAADTEAFVREQADVLGKLWVSNPWIR